MSTSKVYRHLKFASVLLLAATVLPACTNSHSEETNIEIIQDMMDQPALKAQDYEPGHPELASERLPPEGTVPVGYKPYPYHLNPEAAEKNLKNPLQATPQVLELGRMRFETYCIVCHGPKGHGDGLVSKKMQIQVPALISDKVRNFKDGRIFHIISDGQGVMSSYAYQLTNENDRWAIVLYVRSLQKLAAQGK